jgi:hypothetical protein
VFTHLNNYNTWEENENNNQSTEIRDLNLTLLFRFNAWPVLVGICGGPSGSGADFLQALQFFPVSFIPQLLQTHI